VYVENHRVVGLNAKDPIQVNYKEKIGDWPTGREHPEYLKMPLSHGHDMTIVNGISRIGYMTGGRSALWSDEDMAGEIVRRARGFIEQNQRNPFFLYFATHDIHVPRVPRAEFRGTTQCGVRCEVISQLDWTVGEIVETLRRNKLLDNTLLVFTSDNGPVVDDGYADGAPETLNGHKPSGPLRDGKYSPYEGGTRVPFLAHWPARVKAGTSDALLCQIDLMASLSALAGRELPQRAGPDSFDVLPAMLGRTKRGREHLVEQAAGRLALRQGTWRYVEPTPARPNRAAQTAELYDLSTDLAETKNLAAQQPERVTQMAAALDRMRGAGRTRP
jgi:arylsulfatase A-like enzyme